MKVSCLSYVYFMVTVVPLLCASGCWEKERDDSKRITHTVVDAVEAGSKVAHEDNTALLAELKISNENNAKLYKLIEEQANSSGKRRAKAATDSTEQESETPDKLPRLITIKGEKIDADSLIASYTKPKPWTHPGPILDHLYEHGIDPLELIGHFNRDEMERLHSALHEREIIQVKGKTPESVPFMQKSNCPGGVCPLRDKSYVFKGVRYARSYRR